MTAQAVLVHGSRRAEIERRGNGLLDQLRQQWRTYRTYRETLHALEVMEVRHREDIGLAGADLAAVAREATRRRG
jgi:uncharacterized protein YjiS (DUF1127 family)